MTTYVALLRGINVTGRNKIAMADLNELFVALPADGVSTYVQSGNVVFSLPGSDGRDRVSSLRSTIETRIAGTFGLTISVLLRTAQDLQRVVAVNPLLGESRDPDRLHVTFLAEEPASARVDRIDVAAGGTDEWRLAGLEVYLYCPDGYGRTKLNNAFFERRLAAVATTRNWKTVTTLAHLSRQASQGDR